MLVLVAVSLAGFFGAAGVRAANSLTFFDAADDQFGSAPDIRSVEVSNDDAGLITVKVRFPAKETTLTECDVWFDTDNNPSTGDPLANGAEYHFAYNRETDQFGLFWVDAHGGGPIATTTASAATAADHCTMRVNRSEIGNPRKMRVFVWTTHWPGQDPQRDYAPDPHLGSAEYEVIVSAPTTTTTTTTTATTTTTTTSTTTTPTTTTTTPTTTTTTTTTPPPPAARTPGPCERVTRGSNRADRLDGGVGGDTIWGRGGNDRIRGFGGNDCLIAGSGNDKVNGGRGDDTLNGGLGNDTLTGGPGRDTLNGGPGRDVIAAADGVPDTVSCGAGRDVVRVDPLDSVSGCERGTRPA